MSRQYHVYMMTSRRNGPLYIGVTGDLIRRVHEHRIDAVPGFTRRYNCKRLVWFEPADAPEAAIQREKRMKKWNRGWKVELIEKANPEWRDLWPEIVGLGQTSPLARG